MNSDPPIISIIKDNNTNLKICDISSRALFGLVNTGAQVNISKDDINFGENLNNIGYDYIGSLYLPNNIKLDEKNIFTWNKTNSISGKFESEIANTYSNEKIDTQIDIEMSSSDLNLLSFFTGGTEINHELFIEENREYRVLTLPTEFNIPRKISIDYLNSDAFRLCVDENVFDEESIINFLNNENKVFENKLMNILNIPNIEGNIDNDIFYESLYWDKDISTMDDNTPIKVTSYTHSDYSIPITISFLPPKFEIFNKNCNFTGIKNQNVTYKIIFPIGTSVEFSDSLGNAILKKNSEGRNYIEIRFDASESGLTNIVTYKIIPSILFILGLFIPCILSLIITLILVIVIYIVRKRRKRKKESIIEESKEDREGYNNEDYYIPPPPSKR
jgi:hypothetical protein